MKRTIIAVAILLLIVAGSIGTCYTLKKATDELTVCLNEAERAYREENIARCREESEKLKRTFDQYAEIFPFLLNHEMVHNMEESVNQLRTFLETGEATLFLSEVVHCKALVEEAYRKELPLWENIF